jgi:hypothetical protein
MILVAQGSSSAAFAGRQTKMRRRLGVSPGPATVYGPVTASVRMCGRPVASYVSNELRYGCSFLVF